MVPTRLADERVLRGTATPSALPLDFAERAARRFGWLAFGFALTQVLVYLMGAFIQPGWIDPRSAPPLYGASVLGAALLGFAFCALAWSRRIPAPLMLDLALLFEVLASLGIGLAENAVTWPANEPIRGLSGVEVWIVFFVLAVPSTFGKGLLAAVTAALMAPLGLALNILSGSVESPLLSQWLTLTIPTMGMAVCAAVVARFIYNMTGQLGKLREMGSYHLIERLGTGGMGEVWIAQHSLLARRVAIKLIRPDALQGAYTQEVRAVKVRFEREAQAIASLSSPHTVALYDFGSTEDGTFYYVMELLEGIDLYKVVRDYGPIDAARAVYILVQICDALAEAHEKGLVHRDIKPPNLVLSIQGCSYDFAKVLDFGLAKSLAFPEEEILTRPGTTLGTPAFMAPEAATGKANLDGQADVYSLGCVAYFLLTGSLVFPEKSGLAVALAHTHETPLPPSARTEMPLPAQLDGLILECLAKDPAARPAGCRVLAERLLQSIEHSPWTQGAARHWWEVNRPSIPNRGQISPLPTGGRTLRKQTSPMP
ncbi:MAG: serine/threonine-protein kinase [Acidobacteriota bacterium]